MNTIVNIEIAKLLKDKGFDIPKNKMYCRSIPMFEYPHVIKFHDGDKHECSNIPHDWNNTKSPIKSTTYYTAPTISEVVMWLYEKYGLWISIDRHYDKFICKKDNLLIDFDRKKNFYFDSPTESYSAAIEYTLNNLI